MAVLLFAAACAPNSETRPARISFARYSDGAIESARDERRPSVIVFDANWCPPCREMEATTFRDPEVIKAADRFVLLDADLSESDGLSDKLRRKYGIEITPTTVFLDSSGKQVKRVTGYIGPTQFLSYLAQAN
jgi:thiol:disulfide interchange protein DsbD